MQRRISLVGTAIVRRKYGGRRAGGGGPFNAQYQGGRVPHHFGWIFSFHRHG